MPNYLYIHNLSGSIYNISISQSLSIAPLQFKIHPIKAR